MTAFFVRIYRYLHAHRLLCWTLLVGCFAVFGYFASRLHLEEDLNKLMPVSRNADGSTKLTFTDLRIKDKTFLLFEGRKGTSPERIAAVCDAFVDSLQRKDCALDTASQSIGNIFCRLPDDLLPDVIDYLSEHLPCYIDTAVYVHLDTLLTTAHFQRQMEANRRDLTGDFGSMYPELILSDPMGLRNVLAQQAKALGQGGKGGYRVVEDHFFVPDSTVCVAFITPKYSATNTGKGSALFETLNDEIAVFASIAPDVKVCYHGTPASGFYNASQIKSDIVWTIGGSLAVVLLFIMVCYRNWDTLPLLLLPIAFGTLFGLALMYFIKGQFSLLALGIGAVVMGVAMSYALHVLTHYKYVGDPEETLRQQVKPVLLGCLTTVGSFTGIIFIRTELLHDFGLFATFAIVGTTLFSLVFLPQLFGRNKASHALFAKISKINAYPLDRNKPLLAAIGLVIAVCVAFYVKDGTSFDADMHNLGYKSATTTYSENLLKTKTYTGDKQKYFASSGKTMEVALENFALLSGKLDSLHAEGLVKSYTHTDQLLVPLKVQRQRIAAWKRYWTAERLAKVRSLIAVTAPSAGLRAEAFAPFFDCAEADYEAAPLYEASLLPEGYLSTLMERSYGGDYLCYTSVRCANDSLHNASSDYNRICTAVSRSPELLVLDTYFYVTDTLIGMNNDFNVLQWVSMLFVFLVLLFSFRFNLRHTLLGFMPILVSWLVVLGAMALFGVKFNLINIIISTFIFGIGVDYSIFIMNGLIDGNRHSDLLSYHKTAIFFSALILVVTVGSMLFARHPAIRSVGFPTLAGLLSAVIISYVVQPALFRRFCKKDPKQEARP